MSLVNSSSKGPNRTQVTYVARVDFVQFAVEPAFIIAANLQPIIVFLVC